MKKERGINEKETMNEVSSAIGSRTSSVDLSYRGLSVG